MRKFRPLYVFTIFLILGLLLLNWEVQKQSTIARENLHSLLLNQSLQLTNEVTSNISCVYSLRTLVQGSNGATPNLELYGPAIIKGKGKIRNILLAPNGVVATVYPKANNSSVLGLNLLANENKSAEEAQKAQISDDIVLAGPYELKQGGKAISGRLSIFLLDGNGNHSYWGLASVTVDYPKIFSNTALTFLEQNNYCYSFYKEEDNEKEPLFTYKSKNLYKPETVTFNVYNMPFTLEASPVNGWYDYGMIKLGVLAVIGISFLLTIIFAQMMKAGSILKEKANKDPLTGVLNRNAAFKEIQEIMNYKNFENGLFIILDVDNFKTVNDLMGHQIGDKVLKDFAQTLTKNCRDSDIVGRLGGDEFIMYLPYNGTDAFIETKIERLSKNLVNTISFNNKELTITASIGAAKSKNNVKDSIELYTLADKALYKAKENGKNQVVYSFEKSNS